MAIKYKVGQDVIVKRTGEKTHVIATGSNNRYILQNGDNVYDYEIRAAPTEPEPKRGIFRRK